MRVISSFVFICALLFCMLPVSSIQAQTLAFPGAEGFGKFTTGGRGGKVFVVSNLNDNGAGSLRQALSGKGAKTIVFSVSGTIHLQSKLSFPSDVTVAGHSAPGDGICLADYPISLSGNNIIIRYMRFRMGDKNQKGGMVNGNGGDDAFGGTRRNNIIIDHCSISWSTDELFSVYAGDSTTLQWNLISEPLNYSYHFETGDKDYEHHGFGGIWGGKHTTGHHNLFAHCSNRTPRFDGIRNSGSELVDYRNNVIYNWGANNVYAGEGGNYNLVNNYYKYGPSTSKAARAKVVNPYKLADKIPFGKFFVDGNYIDGSPDVTADNWKGVTMNQGSEADASTAKVTKAFDNGGVTTHSPAEAYELVLKQAGASFRRDTLDERIVNNVRNRTGGFIDVQGGYPHGTEYEKTVNAWPMLKSATPAVDTDQDGMPDVWETKNKLNPKYAPDASAYTVSKMYTNIETYLNELLQAASIKKK